MTGLEIALVAAVGLFLLAFGWLALRPWYDFLIQVREGRVKYRGNFPPERRATTDEFFRNEMRLGGAVQVIGRWLPGRKLELKFRGELSAGERQRIRNFLASILRPA